MSQSDSTNCFVKMLRRKLLPAKGAEKRSPLQRTLTVFDLSMYGIGSMCGGYIYGVSIVLIATKSGASSFLSNIIAGIIAALNAQCYVELSSRLPFGGGGYSFTYMICGELFAIIIGWAMLLEYLLGFAFASVGAANAIDVMSNQTLSNFIGDYLGHFPATNGYVTDTPNVLAALIAVIIIILLGFGAKVSISVNAAITIFSSIVLLTCAIFMAIHSNITEFASFHSTNTSLHVVKRSYWMPFGISGMLAGSALTFGAFSGFDALSLMGDVVVNPSRSVPLSINICIILVSLITTFYYLCLSFYLPWFMVNPKFGLSGIFQQQQILPMQILAGIGEITGYLTSGFANMFALSHIIFSLSKDGLICPFLKYVSTTFQVPIFANLIFGSLAAFMALLFDINILANFMSAGTLISYTIVAIDLLIIRLINIEKKEIMLTDSKVGSTFSIVDISFVPCLEQVCFSVPRISRPLCLVISILVLITSCIIVSFIGFSSLLSLSGRLSLISICLLFIFLSCTIIFLFKYYLPEEGFMVQPVPLVPIICIILNIVLASRLQFKVWCQLGIWLLVGIICYLSYGMWHSRTHVDDDESLILIPTDTNDMLALTTN